MKNEPKKELTWDELPENIQEVIRIISIALARKLNLPPPVLPPRPEFRRPGCTESGTARSCPAARGF